MKFGSHGYPVEAGELVAEVVGVEVPTAAYYEVTPEAVLVTGEGRISGGAYWLRLLCGHFLFTAEPAGHGFSTGLPHVACPKCAAGLPTECTE